MPRAQAQALLASNSKVAWLKPIPRRASSRVSRERPREIENSLSSHEPLLVSQACVFICKTFGFGRCRQSKLKYFGAEFRIRMSLFQSWQFAAKASDRSS